MTTKKTILRLAASVLLICGMTAHSFAQTTLTFDEPPGTQNWYNNGLNFFSTGTDQVSNIFPMGGSSGHWVSGGDAAAGVLTSNGGVDFNVIGLNIKTTNAGQISNFIIRGYDINDVEVANSGILNPMDYQSFYGFQSLNFIRVRKLKFEWTNAGTGKVYIDDLIYCMLPTIYADPSNQIVCPSGGNITFTIGDYGAFNYQWQEDQGGGFTNISDGIVYTGVNTSTLNVNASGAMNGWQYRCIAMGSCTPTDTSGPASIVVDGSITAGLSGQSDPSCNGGSNGTATVNVTFGVPPYSYSWSTGGSTTALGNNLPAGTHTCTVTNGCLTTTDVQVILTDPAPLNISVGSQTDVYCNGASNGSATMSVSGGTAPYLLDWLINAILYYSSDPSLTQSGPAGTYSVTVTDVNGCTANTGVFNINEPPALNGSVVSQTDVDCYGNSTGSATVTGVGGTPGYTYNWLSGSTTDTETGMTAGSYSCMITDTYGCQMTFPVTITQPFAMSYSVNTQSSAFCNGGFGSANVMGLGGTFSYTYLWSPSGETTQSASSLLAGTNTLTITDGNGCSTQAFINIGEPPAVQPNFSVTDVSCNSLTDGDVYTSATGGTGTLYYNWVGGLGTASFITGLTAGIYTLEVTDDNSCYTSHTVTVNEPAPLTAPINGTDVQCNGLSNGAATATPSGGTPSYTYNWLPGAETTATITNLMPGSYTVNITDLNGCFTSNTVTITEPTPLTGAASSTDVTCFGAANGTANNGPGGGTPPYIYAWAPSGQTTSTATGLGPGTHTVTITDANGCSIIDFSTVNEPTLLTASILQIDTACAGSNAGVAQVSASGGTPPYSYAWVSGGTATIEGGLDGQPYTCSVTDNNGCIAVPTVNIYEFSTNITGHISTESLPSVTMGSGTVYVVKYQPGAAGYDTVAMVGIDAASEFQALNLDSGQYLVKAILNQVPYPLAIPTYFGNAFQWDSSVVVNHGCITNTLADIEVLELPTATGPGIVSGYILEGDSFGVGARNNGHTGPLYPCVPGGPLKGIDVKLGKNPGGGIQARVMTDSTGYYEFTNLPLQGYKIYVDIPNLPMDSTREIILDATSNVSVQNNYFADSASVFINPDTVVPVGIFASTKLYENNFSIYPNPAKDQLFLKFDLNKAGDVNITLSNAIGQAVKAETIKDLVGGTYTHKLDIASLHLRAGVYFIAVLHNNKKYTQRLVVIE